MNNNESNVNINQDRSDIYRSQLELKLEIVERAFSRVYLHNI